MALVSDFARKPLHKILTGECCDEVQKDKTSARHCGLVIRNPS